VGVRRKAREAALQILYSFEFEPTSVALAVARYWDQFPAARDPLESADGAPEVDSPRTTQEVRGFATQLVQGVLEHRGDIDARIRDASTNWRLERMALVDRNILRIAAYELLWMEDVPRKVSLNEAIEIAKRYGTEDSSAFINGLLDRISQSAGSA
jgi:N utilization substance protein B